MIIIIWIKPNLIHSIRIHTALLHHIRQDDLGVCIRAWQHCSPHDRRKCTTVLIEPKRLWRQAHKNRLSVHQNAMICLQFWSQQALTLITHRSHCLYFTPNVARRSTSQSRVRWANSSAPAGPDWSIRSFAPFLQEAKVKPQIHGCAHA